MSDIDNNNINYLDIRALIRSIQRAENNIDCFRKGHNDCDQFDCAWREYCLNVNRIPAKSKSNEITEKIINEKEDKMKF